MAIANTTTPALRLWLKQYWTLIAILMLLPLLWGGYKIYKDITMPPPLVFLIPDDYFGPVFFFFGQPDGVDVQPDPLGNAVTIPANGILKIKGSNKDLVPSFSNEKVRPLYWVSINKKGERKLLKYIVSAWQDENEQWFHGFVDENSQIQKFPELKDKPGFYYFTKKELDEYMVFSHGGCAHQEFIPENDPKAITPACGKFLVVSPNQRMKLPDFMWEEFAHPFSSIDDLIKQADEALVQKKAFYELP